jgi:hypothetical protein
MSRSTSSFYLRQKKLLGMLRLHIKYLTERIVDSVRKASSFFFRIPTSARNLEYVEMVLLL